MKSVSLYKMAQTVALYCEKHCKDKPISAEEVIEKGSPELISFIYKKVAKDV